jgi:hypothetical protein
VDVNQLVDYLVGRSDKVVVDWGFQPLASVEAIEQLVVTEARLLWFDGHRDAARLASPSERGGRRQR